MGGDGGIMDARVGRGAILAVGLGLLAALTACAQSGDAPGGAPTTTPAAAPTGSDELVFVAFGDSWPYGAHCNGCTPFPELYEQALRESGEDVRFVDRITNGGTSADVLKMIKTGDTIRADVTEADVIVISTGANDIEPAGEAWKEGSCGGTDGLDCFRAVADGWTANFAAIVDEITALRKGAPTAVRLVGNSNEFLADPGLIEHFGADFGTGGGALITQWHNDAVCSAAAEGAAVCIDLRPVLNGPDGTIPADVNTQEAMQKVADALTASGLEELR